MWPHTWNLKKRTSEKPNRNRARGYGEPQVGCRSRFGVDETGEGVETGFLPEVSPSWKCDAQCDDVVNNTVSHI